MSDSKITGTSAAAVANFFLDKYRQDPSVPTLDQMKLQKLVFYAHAWFLAFHKKPLFEEDIGAWPWGPVVKDIYIQTAGHGRDPIRVKIQKIDASGQLTEPMPGEDTKEFLEGVWDAYGQYSGIQLSNATHLPGEPWSIVEDIHGDLSTKPTIPNALIQKIFIKKLPDHDQA